MRRENDSILFGPNLKSLRIAYELVLCLVRFPWITLLVQIRQLHVSFNQPVYQIKVYYKAKKQQTRHIIVIKMCLIYV